MISVGGFYNLALTVSGQVYVWGFGLGGFDDRLTPTLLPSELFSGAVPNHIKSVTAGYDHSFALTVTGQLYAWGENRSGQLGLGDTIDRPTPTLLFPFPKPIRMIAAG
jgi:alpha-tubulin suppressor-like RCC1 family protein